MTRAWGEAGKGQDDDTFPTRSAALMTYRKIQMMMLLNVSKEIEQIEMRDEGAN
jgi:hypothetical protein